MKSILHISVRADVGGGPKHIYSLIFSTEKKLINYVACPMQRPFHQIYSEMLGAEKIVELPFRKFSFISFFKLIKFVKINKIDIVHSHGKGAGVYARLMKLFVNFHLVHTPHGIHLSSNKIFETYMYLIYERMSSWLNDAVIFVSHGEKDRAIKNKIFVDENSRVIYNGVASVSEADFSNSLHVRNLVGANQEDFICICFSRFDEAKNSRLILEIASLLPDLKFIVFGDGPDRENLLSEIQIRNLSNVFMPGNTDIPYGCLVGCNCYVSTSLWEGLPLSLLEAMSCGLPIVATRVTGNIDCVSNDVNGYLYDVDRPDVAANFIRYLSVNRQRAIDMGNAGKKIQSENYSVNTMADKTISLYSDIFLKF